MNRRATETRRNNHSNLDKRVDISSLLHLHSDPDTSYSLNYGCLENSMSVRGRLVAHLQPKMTVTTWTQVVKSRLTNTEAQSQREKHFTLFITGGVLSVRDFDCNGERNEPSPNESTKSPQAIALTQSWTRPKNLGDLVTYCS